MTIDVDIAEVRVGTLHLPPPPAPAPAPAPPPPAPNPPAAPAPSTDLLLYLKANVYALVPLCAAIIVFVLAQFAVQLPTDCPDHHSLSASSSAPQDRLRGNAVFCGPQETVQRVFAEARAELQAIAPLMRPADPASESTRQAELDKARVALFREAKARLLWIGGFSLQLAIACAAILGMGWVLIVSLGEFWWSDEVEPQPQRAVGSIALFLVLLAMEAGAVLYALLWGLAAAVPFRALTAPQLWTGAFFADPIGYAGDTLRQFIGSDLFPGIDAVADSTNAIVFVAVCMIALAVTVTLFDRPDQAARRRAATRDMTYERYLTRCFQRLTVAIYIGATLLVVCVGQENARYAWPGALLPDTSSTLTSAYGALAAQLALDYGLAFSLILAALMLPAWIILRRRAWEVVRAEKPNDSVADQQKWLTDRKMSFTTSDAYGQFIALLAPAGVGSASVLLHLFG